MRFYQKIRIPLSIESKDKVYKCEVLMNIKSKDEVLKNVK